MRLCKVFFAMYYVGFECLSPYCKFIERGKDLKRNEIFFLIKIK
jgi:hypothetical protein